MKKIFLILGVSLAALLPSFALAFDQTEFIPNPVGFHELLHINCVNDQIPDVVRIYLPSNVLPPDVLSGDIPCGTYTFSSQWNPLDLPKLAVIKTCEVNPNLYPSGELHYADCIANQEGIGSILMVQAAYNNTVQNTGQVGWNILFAMTGLYGILRIIMFAF